MRRPLVIVILSFLIFGRSFANEKLTFDPEGNLYKFWLSSTKEGNSIKVAKSLDRGLSFGVTTTLYQTSEEIKSFDLNVGKNWNYFLTLETSKETYLITKEKMVRLFPTTEAIFQPSIIRDELGRVHLIYQSKDQNLKLNRLNYALCQDISSLETTVESQVLFETPDEIINSKIFLTFYGPAITWQKEYGGRKESYFIISLDQGKNFGVPYLLEFYPIFHISGKWFRLQTNDERKEFKEIDSFSPPTPELLGITTRLASPEVFYRLKTENQNICRIEVSNDKSFPLGKTWIFEKFSAPGSKEVNSTIPFELPDGTYYLRLSSFNGLSNSLYSQTAEFKIDTSPPIITLLSPSGEVAEKRKISVFGKISEKASVSLNGTFLTVEADNSFSTDLLLKPGVNTLEVLATDEAGNSSFTSKTITYQALNPEITIVKPSEKEWFKPGATVLFEAEIYDPQNDIEDETEGKITLREKEILESNLIYEKTLSKISGFFQLPRDLPEGKITATVSIADQSGNIGKTTFNINLDASPPIITGTDNKVFSNSTSTIYLPLKDEGAGIDPFGTKISLKGIPTIEVIPSLEGLVIKPILPLKEGSYEVEIQPRDQIGNTGESTTFTLIIDTTPPILDITSTIEEQVADYKTIIEGKIEDKNPVTIKIYNNEKLQADFLCREARFTSEIALLPGNNEIKIMAEDPAGNKTIRVLKTYNNVLLKGAIVSELLNGPNPFSPNSSQPMYFSFYLSQPADIKIYIFDLTGTLIWKRDLNNLSSGHHKEITWDGKDHFGRTVCNGVYPYLFQISSGDTTEIRKGKIIVLQ